MSRKTTSIMGRITEGLKGLVGKAASHPFYNIPMLDGAGGPKLTQAYGQSAWVFRAVQHVVGPISSVDLKWSERIGGEEQPVDEAAVFGDFWCRPLAGKGGKALKRQEAIEAIGVWLCMSGEACIVLDDTWLTRHTAKSRPVLARPDSLRPVTDSTGELVGWRWIQAGRREILLIPEQLVQAKFFNPYDELRGLAPWQAAKIAADSDYAAGVFSKNLGENNGDRGVFIIAKGGMPSDSQREQIEATLRDKRRAARSGDFKIAFLSGDITVEDPKLQAVDAAFVAQRAANRQEIYMAFGVPPSFAEVTASYSIGSASDRFRLIEETCKPMAEKIADAFEQIARMLTGRDLEAEFCWDEHSTMVQVRTERIESASRLWDRGIPWATLDEYFDLDLPDFPGKDVARVSFGLEEVGKFQVSSDQVSSGTNTGDDPLDELRKLMMEPCGCGKCQVSSGQVSSVEGKAGGAEEEKRAALWREHARMREPWAKRFYSRASRIINDARVETLKRLEAQRTKGIESKSLNEVDVVFDLGEFMRSLLDGLGEISQAAMRQAIAELALELGSKDPITLPQEKVLLMARRRGVFLSKTAADIWGEVAEQVREGITQGESIDDLAKRLRGKFTMLSKERSTRIALTETTASYEMARQEGFIEAGVEWKEWLSSRDDRVRDTHRMADGQIVAVDAPFMVHGVPMMHPGAYGAPAELVVNCRCMAIASEEGPKA